jgi:galactokinase
VPRTFRAPGRVNLIGEHTDYAGGLVLPVAIDRAVSIVGDKAENVVRLSSATFGEAIEVASDGSSPSPAVRWGRYVHAVVGELADAGRAPVGFVGRISSDLPVGAGLSSSSALTVAVAVALNAVAGHHMGPLDLAALCSRAEKRAVPVPGGIMDQAVALLARSDHALLLDCSTLEYRHVPLPAGLALVVVHSGVTRRLDESAYAQRRAELEAGDARRRRHFETENERVLRVVEALERDNRDALGRLFAEGHASLRDDFEVSTPELDLLVELAVDAGAVAARMTGGGFGGAIVALADVDTAGTLGREVAREYAARTSLTPEAFVCQAADGAGEI